MSDETNRAQQTREALENQRAHAIVQVLEGAAGVRRRHQFFLWMQAGMQAMLPHTLAICGVYDRLRKAVKLEAFNSIVIPQPVLDELTDGQSPLMQAVIDAWRGQRGQALAIRLAALSDRRTATAVEALRALGVAELLVHGVSRPQRSSEIETLFVLASPGQVVGRAQLGALELMLPTLHSAYLRVQATEHEMPHAPAASASAHNGYTATTLSGREEQVLGCIREGSSNPEIALQLGISPLTVKNHVQNILRKLGAANRAQAVARAMHLDLLPGPADGSQAVAK